MINKRRKLNERKFKNWTETSSGRIYFKKIKGKFEGYAEYIKIVDKNENTLEFTQKIYNENDILVEIHKKYPSDEGHFKV